MQSREDEEKIRIALSTLGISPELIARKKLPPFKVAGELVIAEIDIHGNEYLLVPAAAIAYNLLKQEAAHDYITLEIVSAFRSIDDQIDIIRDKLNCDMSMETILSLSAPPGYSEHHTGCAVDLNTPGCLARELPFANTDAFHWLSKNAGRYGFTLSYPLGNSAGFIYEPWHWLYGIP